MTPMIPKISVSPLATRNSSSPYCTLFRIWISHSTVSVRCAHARRTTKRKAGLAPRLLGAGRLRARHLAAARGIVQRFPRDADHLIGIAVDFAQIDVLDGVVRL